MDELSAPTFSSKTAFAQSLFNRDVPPDWTIGVMDDVLRETEYGLSEPGHSSGDVPIVGMRDLVDGAVNFEELATVDSGGNDWSMYRLRRGDILLNRTNSPDLVGKVGYVREDSDAVFASYLVRLHVDQGHADAEYVAAWLNSGIAQRALKRLSTRGVSQANINPTEFRRHCLIPVPPLTEQRKIAEILRTWDEALEKLTALRAAKARRLGSLRAGLLFGKLRLHRRRHNWAATRLDAVTHELTRRNGAKGLGRDCVMGVTKAEGVVPMREQTIAGDISRYKRLPPRAFAYNPMRINVGSIAMNEREEEVLVSPDYVVFACNADGLEPDYLDHLRKTSWWAHYINSGGSGSVRQRTYYDDLAALKLPLPELDEQRAIAAVLNTARADMAATEREIEAVTQQKRGLMQKLLTGEWRVDSEKVLA